MRRIFNTLAVAAALVLSANANAGFITQYNGNSASTSGNAAVDSTVSFGIYEVTTSDWATTLGVTIGGSTKNSQWTSAGGVLEAGTIFFYQAVNDSPLGGQNLELDQFGFEAPVNFSYTGYLTDAVFNDADGAVGVGNPLNGTTISIVDGSENSVTTVAPSSQLSNSATGTAWRFTTTTIAANESSTILFGTIHNSNPLPPDYASGKSYQISATASTDSDVPVPNPEPGTLALLGIGMSAGGLVYFRRRKATVIVEEEAAE